MIETYADGTALIVGPDEDSRYEVAKKLEKASPKTKVVFADSFGKAVEEKLLEEEISVVFVQWDLVRFSAVDLVGYLVEPDMKCFVTHCSDREYCTYFGSDFPTTHLKNGFSPRELESALFGPEDVCEF